MHNAQKSYRKINKITKIKDYIDKRNRIVLLLNQQIHHTSYEF